VSDPLAGLRDGSVAVGWAKTLSTEALERVVADYEGFDAFVVCDAVHELRCRGREPFKSAGAASPERDPERRPAA
jgi:hypothetical protein